MGRYLSGQLYHVARRGGRRGGGCEGLEAVRIHGYMLARGVTPGSLSCTLARHLAPGEDLKPHRVAPAGASSWLAAMLFT
jgi:hypothetical protein